MKPHHWAAVVVLAVVAWFVWPTPWRYDHLGPMRVREHRITGEIQKLTADGWVRLRGPAPIAGH